MRASLDREIAACRRELRSFGGGDPDDGDTERRPSVARPPRPPPPPPLTAEQHQLARACVERGIKRDGCVWRSRDQSNDRYLLHSVSRRCFAHIHSTEAGDIQVSFRALSHEAALQDRRNALWAHLDIKTISAVAGTIASIKSALAAVHDDEGFLYAT